MPKFEVTVIRSCSASRVIEVEASCEMQAKEMAIDAAGDYEFSEKEADYSVDDVRELIEEEEIKPQLGRKYYCAVWDGSFPGKTAKVESMTDKGWLAAVEMMKPLAEEELGGKYKTLKCVGVETLVMNEEEWPVDTYIDCASCDNCEVMSPDEQRHHAKQFDLVRAFGDNDDSPDLWEVGVYRCHECGAHTISKIKAAEFFEKEEE